MMRIIRSIVPLTVALLVLGACGKKEEAAPAAAAKPGAEEPTLNVYNWSDYMGEKTLEDFTKETGIKVNYVTMDSNEMLETKLLAGSTGYDVVVPSANFLERQIKAGVYQPLDKSKLPNLANMDTRIMGLLDKHDPGNKYAIDYMWGTTGIGYNVKMIKEKLGKVPDSWSVLFDPANAKKLKGCGISMLDAPSEVIDSAQVYLGIDPNSEKTEDLQKAIDLLKKVHPFVRYYNSSQYIDDLANGTICIALGWSGDVFIARKRAREASNGIDLAYFIPKEGAILWFDTMAIPKDAPHPNNAHVFLNYIMRPQVVGDITNFIEYANGNQASLQYVHDSIKTDPNAYPTPEVMAKLSLHLAESQEYSKASVDAFTVLKTGQ